MLVVGLVVIVLDRTGHSIGRVRFHYYRWGTLRAVLLSRQPNHWEATRLYVVIIHDVLL